MGKGTFPGLEPTTRRRGWQHLRWALAWPLFCLVAAWVGAAPVRATALATPPPPADERGLPFIRNFDPSEYGAAPQNWAITQDDDGVIYVGNVENGVLAFDGVRWQRIAIPNHSAVRSLATGTDGRIYVGAVGEMGYLARDRAGQMHYVSLLDRVPVAERGFADVWDVFPTAEGVYFSTFTSLIRLRGSQVKVWKPQSVFHMSFSVGGTLYIRDTGRGLLRLEGDRLLPVPGGERFAKEKIYALLPWDAHQLLIGTRTQGWWLFDGHRYTPWRTEVDEALRHDMLYQARWLTDGQLAMATLQGGVYLLDRDGRLRRHLTEDAGLLNNVVSSLFEDRQHGLWLTLDTGIARVAVDAPITRFGPRSGLAGAVLALCRHAGHLYAGTTEGLFRLDPDRAGVPHFERIAQVAGQTWQLLDMGDALLTGSSEGVYAITGGAPLQVLSTEHTVFSLLRSRADPSRIFVGMQDGVSSIRRVDGRWLDEGRIGGTTAEPRSLFEDSDGRLWLGTWDNAVLRMTLPPGWHGARDTPAPVRIERFGAADGLPVGQSQVYPIDGQPRFGTAQGIYRFDPATGRFSPDARFAGLFPSPRQVTLVRQDSASWLWLDTIDEASGLKEAGAAVRGSDGRWRWQPSPLQPMSGSAMLSIPADADGTMWFGGDKGLFRYDPRKSAPGDAPFRALLRKVSGRDGVALPGSPQIPHAGNTLRFAFAAPGYDIVDANRFQVKLEGLDEDWSAWSREAYRDYTNLPEGDYRFRVRARNAYGQVGKEATFAFRVLPPWYRTTWAWLAWIIGTLALVALAGRWRLAALRRRNRELAALVEQRTHELKAANDALAEQTVTDPLTGLRNRRYLHDHIEQDVAMARRHYQDQLQGRPARPQPMALLFLMVDVDHFKEVNDTYGHAAGDRVLQQLRDILLSVTRDSDTPVRWGGEEFLIVARFAPHDAGPQFAERIRAAVAGHSFDLGEGRSLRRTCSVGFASYPFFGEEPDRLNWEQVVNIADECLYAAKRHGRNAWVGVPPMLAPVDGNLLEVLQASLAGDPDGLPVLASWACAAPAGA